MNTPSLPPSILAALNEVADIADALAATACHCGNGDLHDMDLTGVLNNLDSVASALTWNDLEDAPAKLNAAAAAFRITFRFETLGWEDAGRLQTIASDIAAAFPYAL